MPMWPDNRFASFEILLPSCTGLIIWCFLFTPNNFSLKERKKKIGSFKILNFFKLKTAPCNKSIGQIKISHSYKSHTIGKTI